MAIYNPAAIIERVRQRERLDLYRQLVLPLFFRLEPETAHRVALDALRAAGRLPFGRPAMAQFFDASDDSLQVSVLGLSFRNPIGLAAGYDKNAQAVRELSTLGFGHVEVGTITPRLQAGNTLPRVFRLPEEDAVINRMGFPNQGADRLYPRLERARKGELGTQIGVNIGKQRETPLEDAAKDYCLLLRRFHPVTDFIAINVSSPNTPDLRKLQARGTLESLLRALSEERQRTCPETPWLLKIAPDLSDAELDDVLDVALRVGISGIIATNTTTGRHDLACTRPVRDEIGGMSGPALRRRSTEIIRAIYQRTDGRLPIIGVGGVDSAAAALEKIRAGASLVQVYTGLIYQGPALVRAINRGLAEAVGHFRVRQISDLVGTA